MNLKVTVKKENKQKLLSHEFRRRNRAELDTKQQMTPAASTAQESTIVLTMLLVVLSGHG